MARLTARTYRFARPVTRLFLLVLAGSLVAGAFAGCGTLNSWAQTGPSLKPSVGSSVSIPLGK